MSKGEASKRLDGEMREGDLCHVLFDRWKEVGVLLVEIWGIANSCLRLEIPRSFWTSSFLVEEECKLISGHDT